MAIAFAMLGVVLGIIFFVLSLFFGHIILFDSIVFAIIMGTIFRTVLDFHMVFCILIGVASFLLFFWLEHTKIGFWIISILLSLSGSGFFGLMIGDSDIIWGWFVFVVLFMLILGLHIYARNKSMQHLSPPDNLGNDEWIEVEFPTAQNNYRIDIPATHNNPYSNPAQYNDYPPYPSPPPQQQHQPRQRQPFVQKGGFPPNYDPKKRK